MKYSIIVPVYGVEKYLDQCVESVLAQSFTDFELILVDDKSPDNCPAMCDSWAQKDARIRVVHKPVNEGLGFARNTGMDAAQGEYVTFLDSDDYISPTHLSTCDSALTADTDILVFGIESVYENKDGNVVYRDAACPPGFTADTPEKRGALFAALSRASAFPYACNKTYRRAFLQEQQARFEKTKLIEDFLFNIGLFGKAQQIVAVSDVLYYYRKPAHETLVSRYAPEFFDLCKRKYQLEEGFLRACNALTEEHCSLIQLNYLKHIVSAVIKNRSKAASLTRTQQKQRLQEMLDDTLTVSVLAQYIPADRTYRVIRDAMYKKQVGRVLTYCVGIHFVQRNMLPLYRKLLSRRRA